MQQELEEQLRAFGDTMSDAFAHGFEGKGMDIGDRAWDVGKAAVHAPITASRRRARPCGRPGTATTRASGRPMPTAARQSSTPGCPVGQNFFASRPELTPVEKLRKCAKERYNSGVALLAVGIIFAVLFGLAQWAASSGWALFRRLLWTTLWCRLLRAAAS